MKDLLLSAKHEIEDLRRRNELLTAKVEVMDLFGCLLHTSAARRLEGQSVDVAWQLQKKIDELDDSEAEVAVA